MRPGPDDDLFQGWRWGCLFALLAWAAIAIVLVVIL